MTIGNQPAFPSTNAMGNSGMTYRQWLIGMALQGILASEEGHFRGSDINAELADKAAGAVIKLLHSEKQ